MAVYPKKLKPARIWPNNAVQAIRLSVNQAAPNPAAGVVALTQGVPKHIGTIPAGSVILAPRAHIKTAFTAAVTINIGSEADPDGVMTTAEVAPQATGWKIGGAGALSGRTEVDLPVFLLADGAAPAAGEGEFLLEFYTAKD